MQYLAHTVLWDSKVKGLIKFEIYSDFKGLDPRQNLPQEYCRVLAYSMNDNHFEIIDSNVDLSQLYEQKKPAPEYSFMHRGCGVNLDVLVKYLTGIY